MHIYCENRLLNAVREINQAFLFLNSSIELLTNVKYKNVSAVNFFFFFLLWSILIYAYLAYLDK
jgi:hypothetical protein